MNPDWIYLDNNATTRPAREVIEAMRPWLEEAYGNPSAGYRFGREARRAVDLARGQVAALIGAEVEEIVENGAIEPDNVHTPGVFVQRVVRIERSRTAAGARPSAAACR